VERRGQLLQISLNRYAPVPALLALIRHIRMVEGRISLRTELPILGDRKRLTVSDACLSLGRYAMLHFGHMLLPSAQERKDELQPFRRLIMPISAKTERPSNYRVLTAAIRLSDGAWIL
jgi:hypothetical protein